MMATECVISSGWVRMIVVFAGRSIVSYSGLVEASRARSWASVVGAGLGGGLVVQGIRPGRRVPVAAGEAGRINGG